MPVLITADAVRTAAGLAGDAVLIDGGTVSAVGDAAALRRPGLDEVHHPGAIVPGLRDAHLHPVAYAAAVTGLGLKDAASLADLTARIRDHAAGLAPGEPVIGVRLDDAALGRLPQRTDLDAAVADRPVLLHRYCGHVAVANTAALDHAGIGAGTPDPAGGSLDRDGAGLPTGVLRETAITLVSTSLHRARPVGPDLLAAALAGLASTGLTSIGAMVGLGDGPWASLGDEVEVLAEAAALLPITVHAYVIANTPEQLRAAAHTLDAAASPRLRFAGLKRFGDGSFGGHTAAMRAPFADRPTTGTLRLDPDRDEALIATALELGGQVAIHAIGDRAVSEVLDLYEPLVAGGIDPGRLRIEHVSVIGAGDRARMAGLGVIGVVQPAFLGSEHEWLEQRVGADRIGDTYAFRSMLDAGVRLAGSSDSPVEPPHPLWGMALARDRAGVVPGEGLDPAEALRLFTDDAAAALEEPAPLAPGSPADLVVLDRDPVAATPAELRSARVTAAYGRGARIEFPAGWTVWRA